MLRLLVTFVLLAGLCGCAPVTSGHPLARSRPATTAPPPGATTPATLRANLCSFLTLADLRYPGTDPSRPPSKTGGQGNWTQTCQWEIYEPNAGVTLPPVPTCDSDGSAVGSAQCAVTAASALAQITANSSDVLVSIGWQPNHITVESTSTYTEAGHLVVVNDESANWTCIMDVHWAEGTLGVEVQDSSRAFGTPCAQATRFTNLLISREPH
jgi:hypothetical protein